MAKLMGNPNADTAEDLITALSALQAACGVEDLKMSDYGITLEKFPGMVQNARDTLGVNFLNDPVALSDVDCIAIYQESYR